MRRWMMTATAALAAIVLAAPAGAGAHDDEGDTYLIERGTGTIELSPGLCFPGMESCEAPAEAQFRVQFETCAVNGVFEGVELPADDACDGENHGFTEGAVLGLTTPFCGLTHSYTSEATTAWGSDAPNTQTINGQVRNEQFRLAANGGGVLTLTGWLDDADADDDPAGDHSLAAVVIVRPVAAPGTVPCVDTPATLFTFQTVAIFS